MEENKEQSIENSFENRQFSSSLHIQFIYLDDSVMNSRFKLTNLSFNALEDLQLYQGESEFSHSADLKTQDPPNMSNLLSLSQINELKDILNENRKRKSLSRSQCTNSSKLSEITELSCGQFDKDIHSKPCCTCLIF